MGLLNGLIKRFTVFVTRKRIKKSTSTGEWTQTTYFQTGAQCKMCRKLHTLRFETGTKIRRGVTIFVTNRKGITKPIYCSNCNGDLM